MHLDGLVSIVVLTENATGAISLNRYLSGSIIKALYLILLSGKCSIVLLNCSEKRNSTASPVKPVKAKISSPVKVT
jgi:hypothetical protein